MRVRNHKLGYVIAVSIVVVCAIGILLAFVRRPTPDRRAPIDYVKDGVRTTITHGWYPGHVGIAGRIGNAPLTYHSLKPGDGTLIRLHRNDFLVDSFDGGSYYVIAFQLPDDVEVGKPYELKPIPSDRNVTPIDEWTSTTPMKPGEFTAFQYGNPSAGCMSDDPGSTATVTVLETGEFETVVHVRLVADLEPTFDFDIDQEYTLRTMADGAS